MVLSYTLQKAGFDTLVAYSADEALRLYEQQIRAREISLILLDIMMDGMSGMEMFAHLRATQPDSQTLPPVIFLTALNDERTVLKGFHLGADDYISKPFRAAEVVARIEAVLRRHSTPHSTLHSSLPFTGEELCSIERPVDGRRTNRSGLGFPSTLHTPHSIIYEGIVINQNDMSITIDGQPVEFTRKELDLLSFLLTNRGSVFSRAHLLNAVWGKDSYVLERTVDVHITHLRRKLGPYGKRILTKSGYGYLFEK